MLEANPLGSLVAILAASAWGAGDFMGGLAARKGQVGVAEVARDKVGVDRDGLDQCVGARSRRRGGAVEMSRNG